MARFRVLIHLPYFKNKGKEKVDAEVKEDFATVATVAGIGAFGSAVAVYILSGLGAIKSNISYLLGIHASQKLLKKFESPPKQESPEKVDSIEGEVQGCEKEPEAKKKRRDYTKSIKRGKTNKNKKLKDRDNDKGDRVRGDRARTDYSFDNRNLITADHVDSDGAKRVVFRQRLQDMLGISDASEEGLLTAVAALLPSGKVTDFISDVGTNFVVQEGTSHGAINPDINVEKESLVAAVGVRLPPGKTSDALVNLGSTNQKIIKKKKEPKPQPIQPSGTPGKPFGINKRKFTTRGKSVEGKLIFKVDDAKKEAYLKELKEETNRFMDLLALEVKDFDYTLLNGYEKQVAQHGSVQVDAAELADRICSVTYTNSDNITNKCCAIAIGNNLVTVAHILIDNNDKKNSDVKEINYSFKTENGKVKVLKVDFNSDVMVLQKPSSMKSFKISKEFDGSKQCLLVYLDPLDNKMKITTGQANFKNGFHTCSSVNGACGGALITDSGVIGIHSWGSKAGNGFVNATSVSKVF
jgi:hypothetical protein